MDEVTLSTIGALVIGGLFIASVLHDTWTNRPAKLIEHQKNNPRPEPARLSVIILDPDSPMPESHYMMRAELVARKINSTTYELIKSRSGSAPRIHHDRIVELINETLATYPIGDQS